MGLRSEVDDDVVPGDHLIQQFTIADITVGEGVAGVLGDRCEIRQVASVGQFVEHMHAIDVDPEGPIHKAAHIVGSDKTSAAGHQVSHPRILRTGERPKG